MKKFIISIVLSLVLLTNMMSIVFPKFVFASELSHNLTIFVNNVKLGNEINVTTNDTAILLPLRAILETLGAEVHWDESTGNIYFNYAETNYVCKFVPLNLNYPDIKSILICKSEYKDSTKSSDYIMLNPMGASGSYCIINDRTYLYHETGKRLLEALGCNVEFDSRDYIIRISN